MKTAIEEGILEKEPISSEEENQGYVDAVLEKYPRIFKQVFLEEGSNAAVLYNGVRIPQAKKEILPDYGYIVFSKYGVTMFNVSCERVLGYELTRRAILKLVELSDGSEVKDLVISEWRKVSRNRINKGLIPLRGILRSVTISGRHVREGVSELYTSVSGVSHSVV